MAKNKISSMLVFTVVIFLALAIVSSLYFFNIKKNEEYQNQLHFRELNSVANEVTSGYTQFVKISTVLLNIRNATEQSRGTNTGSDNCDDPSNNSCMDKLLNLQTGSFVNRGGTGQSEIVSVTNRARESRALQNLITAEVEVNSFYKLKSDEALNALKDSPLIGKYSVAWSSNNETMFGTPNINIEAAAKRAESEIVESRQANKAIQFTEEAKKIAIAENIKKEIQKEKDKLKRDTKMNVTLIPTSDLIPDQVLSFPFIVLAGKDGSVKARKFFYENSTDTADLEFTSVNKILTALYNQQKEEGADDAGLPTYSGTVDRVIGGIQYRIFIQPANISMATGTVDTHYLLGFVALNEFRLTNLSVNPSAGLWIMIVLIGLTAIIPLLKLRFTAPQEHFTRTDINLFFTGCFLLLGLVSITITHQFFSDYLKDSTLQQSKNLFANVQSDFEKEIEKVKSLQSDEVFSDTLAEDNEQSCELLEVNAHQSRGFASNAKIISENCINEALRYELKLSMYNNTPINAFAESAFRLNNAGLIPTRLAYKDEREAIQRVGRLTFNYTDFSLSHRDYFQRAITCDLWSSNQKFESDCNDPDKLYIQRIKNVSDGRLSTQFAFADFKDLNNLMRHHHNVKSISIKLRTFFDRIMPKNFGYAVFDNQGQVLYHSNQERSLAENILVETNNNPSIDLLINSTATKNDIVVFDAIYRNAKHRFVGGAIHDVVPWKLVVFYDLKDLESTGLWTFLLAIFLFVQILLILFLWSRLATNQDAWTRLIAFCPARQRSYLNCGMFMLAGVVLCLTSIGVIVDLSARLALWLGLMAYYIYIFNKSFGEETKRKHIWTHPMMPFSLLSILFAIYFISYANPGSFTFDNAISIGFAVVGLLFFVIARIGFARPELFLPMGEWLRKKLFASYHSPFRYTYRYVFYLSVFIWFFAMVPGVLIINAANQYLLKVQAFNQSTFIEQREKEHLASLHDYFTLVGANADGDKVIDNMENIDLAKARSILLSCKDLPWIRLANKACNAEPSEQGDQDKISLHVDPLFNKLIETQSFGGSLSEDLYQFAQLAQKNTLIEYNANSFFLHAFKDKVLLVIALLIVLFLLTLLFVRRAIVHGIMGEHIPDHPTLDNTAISLSDFLDKHLAKQGARLQILQAENEAVTNLIMQKAHLVLLGDKVFDITHISSMRQNENKQDIVTWLNGLIESLTLSSSKDIHKVLVLGNFEKLVSDKLLRSIARAFIKELHDQHDVSVILLSDVDILNQFNDCIDANDEDTMYSLPINESLAWSLFLRRYTNFTMRYAEQKKQLEDDPSTFQSFIYETQGWPELERIGDTIKNTLVGENASQDFEHVMNTTWKPAQIVQFFNEQSTAFYRYKWSLCNIAERLMLFQLAQGGVVNPANENTLNSLVKRGYIYRDSGWFIVNDSFKCFIMTAESEARFQSWLQRSKNNTWKLIRIPIFVTILVLVALIVIATGQSIQSILATATAALGLVSLLMRNLSTFRGGSPSNADSS